MRLENLDKIYEDNAKDYNISIFHMFKFKLKLDNF